MPKVSICIPIYNGEQYLEDALNSVLNQTYKNFEVVIVDDQSTDKSHEIAKSYALNDTRIHVFKNEKNLGLVGNWNKCIELAKGEWIKFVFQDDLITDNCLELMMASANDKSRFIACYRDFLFEADVNEGTIETFRKYPRLSDVFEKKINVNNVYFAQTVLSCPDNFIGEPTSTLIHKTVFDQYGYFNPSFSQLCDIEYWIRIGVNEGLTIIPHYLAHFRVHSNSTTSLNAKQHNFRTHELEDLLLLHEFAFNPQFAILRQSKSLSGKKINLKKEFAKKAFWFKNTASARQKQSINANELKIWTELANQYPKFETSWHLLPLKANNWLKSKMWRFYR